MDRNKRVRIDVRLRRLKRLIESETQDAIWRHHEEKVNQKREGTQPQDTGA